MHFSSVVVLFLAALSLAPPGYGETTCGALCQNTVTSSTVFNFISDLIVNGHECKDCGTLNESPPMGTGQPFATSATPRRRILAASLNWCVRHHLVKPTRMHFV
jgi:hypothetical protein